MEGKGSGGGGVDWQGLLRGAGRCWKKVTAAVTLANKIVTRTDIVVRELGKVAELVRSFVALFGDGMGPRTA